VVLTRPGRDVGDAIDGDWLKAEFGIGSYAVYPVSGADPVGDVLDHMETAAAQLLVVLPGKHSLFYRLTHRDILRAIAQNAEYPVLLLK
jgi:hypothetical protein